MASCPYCHQTDLQLQTLLTDDLCPDGHFVLGLELSFSQIAWLLPRTLVSDALLYVIDGLYLPFHNLDSRFYCFNIMLEEKSKLFENSLNRHYIT